MSWNKTAELGSVLGMRFVLLCLRLFGRRAARLVSEPAILYYFLSNRRARAASREYLRRVASHPEGLRALGGAPTTWTSWMHFRAFGHSLVDRACFWAGRSEEFQVEFPARDELAHLREQKRGALLYGAHLGSIDVLRALVSKKSTPVNILMYGANARKLNAVLKSVDPDLDFRAIPLEQGSVQFILDLQACIARGEFVALLGDRAELASEKRTARARFLGGEASFPLGPLWIAHLLECPVYLIFALNRGRDSYEICLESFAERILLDRKQRDRDLQAWLERYVRRLEAQCLSTPLQWFNFYDFWSSDAAVHDSPETLRAERA
jgi:predicted LPLAT superfamily acyltransferase